MDVNLHISNHSERKKLVGTFCSTYCHVDSIMMVVMVLMLMTIIQSYSKLSYSYTFIVSQTSRREQSSTCFFGVFSLAPSCLSVASTCVSAGSQKHHHHHSKLESNQGHHDRIHNHKNNHAKFLGKFIVVLIIKSTTKYATSVSANSCSQATMDT